MLSRCAVARHSRTTTTTTRRPPPTPQRWNRRWIQTATVTDSDVSRLAAEPPQSLALSDLCRHGRPPLSQQALLDSANFTLSLLPARLAHRILSLRALPYIVVANPHVAKIHANYVHSLSTLLPYAETRIDSPQQEMAFTEVMADLVHTHNNTIAVLARGFLEARKYISKDHITRFLDEHLRARIGTRLIAEQHIALHWSSQPHNASASGSEPPQASSYIGVIDTALDPASVVRACERTVGEICELTFGVRPAVRITLGGDSSSSSPARIAYIPTHLEYILTELLKNSFRAVLEAGAEKHPVEVTIAPAPAGGLTLRIRDRGGGISPENLANLWEYGFTTFNEDEMFEKVCGRGSDGLDGISAGAAVASSSLAGLGYGLPLARAYAEYSGGGIAVQSLWGWGTDVYLTLKGVNPGEAGYAG